LADFELPHARRRLDLEGIMSDSFEPVLRQLDPTSVLHGYFVGLRQRVRARAEQWGLATFEECICHGDLNFANCLRLDDGRIGLFDFECCGPGLRVYDLAVFRWTQLTVGAHDDTWSDFLAGYGAGGAINERELAAMDLLVLLRQAWLIGHDARRTEIQSLGTRWRRVGTRNLDVLRRFDSELFGA
jgi:Ser/Thr protein kinase RdoA (MazF antagonist)